MHLRRLLPLLAIGILALTACGETKGTSSTSLEYTYTDERFDSLYLASNVDSGALARHIESKSGKKIKRGEEESSTLTQYFSACQYDSFCYDYHLANGVSWCDIWFFPNSGAFVVRGDGINHSSLDAANITYRRDMTTHWVFKIGQKASAAGYAGWYMYRAYLDGIAQAWYNATVVLKPSILHRAEPDGYFWKSYFDNYSVDVKLTSVTLGDPSKADQLCRSELNDIASFASNCIADCFASIEDDLKEVNPSYHLFNKDAGTPFVPGQHVSEDSSGKSQSSSQQTSQSSDGPASSSSSSHSSSNTSGSSNQTTSSSSSSSSHQSSIQYDYAEYYDYDGTLLASLPFEHGTTIPAYPKSDPSRPDDSVKQLTYQFAGWDFEDKGGIKKFTAKYESCTIGLTINTFNGWVTAYSGTSKSVVIPEKWSNTQVTNISADAFIENTLIESVMMPDSIVEIPSVAFAGCSSLKNINIGKGVTSIGMRAFRNCTSLTSIFIPINVESISNYAFENCSSLTINCEATSKPSGWDYYWNSSNRPVNWGVAA